MYINYNLKLGQVAEVDGHFNGGNIVGVEIRDPLGCARNLILLEFVIISSHVYKIICTIFFV